MRERVDRTEGEPPPPDRMWKPEGFSVQHGVAAK
jgi:hypothetical protein